MCLLIRCIAWAYIDTPIEHSTEDYRMKDREKDGRVWKQLPSNAGISTQLQSKLELAYPEYSTSFNCRKIGRITQVLVVVNVPFPSSVNDEPGTIVSATPTPLTFGLGTSVRAKEDDPRKWMTCHPSKLRRNSQGVFYVSFDNSQKDVIPQNEIETVLVTRRLERFEFIENGNYCAIRLAAARAVRDLLCIPEPKR